MMRYFLVLFFIVSCYGTELFVPIPLENKDIDQKVVNLGEELFFDPILSKNKDVSCFSCHYDFGSDSNTVSIGSGGKKGFVQSLSVFNTRFNIAHFWNGRAKDLKDQLKGPITQSHEMSMNIKAVEKRLQSSKKYTKLFYDVFNAKPTFDLISKAIVEFEKTLTTPNSKFDKFLRGETKLSKKEKAGYDLFNNYGCSTCHNGINLGGNSFQKFGSVIPYHYFTPKINDRYTITKDPEDIGVYKVASLRNVAKTAPYFHTGEISDLKSAISIMAYYNLGKVLTNNEIEAIESFLKTLTGTIPEAFKRKAQ